MAVVWTVSGGFAERYGTDGMMIWNKTSADIDVSYRRAMGNEGVMAEDFVQNVGANRRVTVIGLHQTEGPCLRGTLIAVQGERTIATLSQACEGTEWVVTLPED